MSIYIPNEAIIADFIRENVTDPSTDRFYNSDTESFTSGTSQSEYTLTAPSGSVSHVTSVTIDGVSKTKWKDYYWDYKGSKVILKTSEIPSSGVIVEITYQYGSTNWVFNDLPVTRLGTEAFPRIRVFKVSQPGQRLGNYKAPVESEIRFQVDFWCKEKISFTINGIGNGRKYSGEALAEILARQVQQLIEDNVDDLYPLMYNYTLQNTSYMGFESDYQAHHWIYEFTLQTVFNGLIN